MLYNEPGVTESTIGPAGGSQLNPFYFYKKALTEIAKEQYFGQLADVRAMPKNMGKTIKQYHYLPILDDRNVYTQGLDAAGNAINPGNLYGSSKDIGTIPNKLPTLSENGGRVNRVGMTRIQIEGSIEKFGFFDEYTKESIDFDSDPELEMHITSESLKAANEITEDQLQLDLLAGAGVVRYTGNATADAEVSGNTTGGADLVTYNDLVKLSIELDNNRTPKQTKIISGSRMVDTRVVNAARYMYIGSEVLPSLLRMTNYHGEKAFIPVAQYADAGNVARGEVGAIDNFRIIVVPEMMKWAGAGAAVVDNGGNYAVTGSNYDIFPMLVVGDGSFTTIGFQTDGKTVKFSIKHMKPGSEASYTALDPYGETGFYSIKWYYGTMILRPERIALIKTIGEA